MRVDPSYIANLTGALGGIAARQQQLTSELSSGVRVTTLSDDPVAAGENVRMTAGLGQDAVFLKTASSVESMLQVTDSTLGAVVSQITSAISNATLGLNGTASSSNLKAVARQLTGIRDDVLALANTAYQGRYLFAGSQTATQPFTLDTASTPALALYHGDAVTSVLETPTGQRIQINVPGSDVFTAPGNSVLGTLNSLIEDFASGTASPTGQSDLTQLNQALGQLDQQRATIGDSLSRLNAATGYTQNMQTLITAQQTALMQADIPQVATSLSLASTQRSAVSSVIAMLEKQGTLFDLL